MLFLIVYLSIYLSLFVFYFLDDASIVLQQTDFRSVTMEEGKTCFCRILPVQSVVPPSQVSIRISMNE